MYRYIQRKDLDEITSSEKICTALKQEFKLEGLEEVSLKNEYGDTQSESRGSPVIVVREKKSELDMFLAV